MMPQMSVIRCLLLRQGCTTAYQLCLTYQINCLLLSGGGCWGKSGTKNNCLSHRHLLDLHARMHVHICEGYTDSWQISLCFYAMLKTEKHLLSRKHILIYSGSSLIAHSILSTIIFCEHAEKYLQKCWYSFGVRCQSSEPLNLSNVSKALPTKNACQIELSKLIMLSRHEEPFHYRWGPKDRTWKGSETAFNPSGGQYNSGQWSVKIGEQKYAKWNKELPFEAR